MSAGTRRLPAVERVTFGQAKGWNCIWCGKLLTTGAVSAGRIDEAGARGLSFEVFACPDCGVRGRS
ncbi:hypothetical protein [Streptomyces flavidovirens]|uniref:hypothetical protein n=1 Tax=Streptomyces flavidovirens TaxID=67298 RepID=UPI0036BA07F8